MKANYQVEITFNSDKTGSEKNTEQIVEWLQTMMPSITRTRKMITDEFFLAPLEHAVSLCLN